MFKNKSHIAAFFLVYVLHLLALGAYVTNKVEVLQVNNSQFVYAGMMEQNDNGKPIYVPVFRRIK